LEPLTLLFLFCHNAQSAINFKKEDQARWIE
jgi:hypothetical protein